MISFFNGKTLSDRSISFRIVNSRFSEVKIEPSTINQVSEANSLESLASLLSREDKAVTMGQKDIAYDLSGYLVLPAGIDAHVHSRSPGLEHKEDWHSLAQSAYKGGVTSVADMPNTVPPMLFSEQIEAKKALAKASGLGFKLYLGVGDKNVQQLPHLLKKYPDFLAGLKVFYGKSTGDLIYSDLEMLHRSLGEHVDPIITFHAEDQKIIDEMTQRYRDHLNDSEFGTFKYHSFMRPTLAANQACQYILAWGLKTGRRLHIAHISTPDEVELITQYQQKGLRVSCEIAPHHLLLSDENYEELGPFLKVNPPVRSMADVKKMREHFAAGRIDIFATDHAPHLKEEKLKPLNQAPSGMPAIEFFYPLLLQSALTTGLSLEHASKMGSAVPARLFGYVERGEIRNGFFADFVIMKKLRGRVGENMLSTSKCGWSPYHNLSLDYQVVATFHDGRLRYANPKFCASLPEGPGQI